MSVRIYVTENILTFDRYKPVTIYCARMAHIILHYYYRIAQFLLPNKRGEYSKVGQS